MRCMVESAPPTTILAPSVSTGLTGSAPEIVPEKSSLAKDLKNAQVTEYYQTTSVSNYFSPSLLHQFYRMVEHDLACFSTFSSIYFLILYSTVVSPKASISFLGLHFCCFYPHSGPIIECPHLRLYSSYYEKIRQNELAARFKQTLCPLFATETRPSSSFFNTILLHVNQPTLKVWSLYTMFIVCDCLISIKLYCCNALYCFLE